jgi:hypothetical protein
VIHVPGQRSDPSLMWTIEIRCVEAGERLVTWRSTDGGNERTDGRLVHEHEATPRSQRRADILICPAQPNDETAADVLEAALRRLPGCLIAATTISGRAISVLRYRDGQTARRNCPDTDLERWAALAHAWVVAGHPLATLG